MDIITFKATPGAWQASDYRNYDILPTDKKEIIQAWIATKLHPRAKPNYDHTSYGLKHMAERVCGFYISNGQFKGAMLAAGYQPVNRFALNWVFSFGWNKSK